MKALKRIFGPAHSLRFKLIASVALIHFILMTVFIIESVQRQEEDIEFELAKRASGLAKMLSVTSVNAVLSEDLGSLVEYVAALGGEPEVVYAVITDRNGVVLSATDYGLVGKVIKTRERSDSLPLARGDDVLDTAFPIEVGGQRIGMASLGISTKRMQEKIADVKVGGYMVIMLAIVIGSVSAWVLSVLVTRSLHRLMGATDSIRKGDFSVRSGVRSRDEIGHLARTFDGMAESLQKYFLETQRASSEIKYLNKLNNHIVENVSYAICLLDSEMKVIRSNERYEQLDRELGRPFICMDMVKDRLGLAADSRQPIRNLEFSHYARDGGTKVLLINIYPLLNDSGDVMFYLLEISDITEQKEFEQELLQTAKFTCLGQVAAGIAHEIKNPLTGMVLGLNTLKRNGGNGESSGVIIDDIVKDIDRLNKLVTQLLSFSTKREVKLEAVRIAEQIDRALVFVNKQARNRNITITRNVEPWLEVKADKDQLHQVFLNIVLNSIQAMPGGGEISISATSCERTVHNSRLRGARIVFEDTGPGISESELDKAFNPFFTSKKGGTGLGLAICHRIIEDHNGVITLSNREPGGLSAHIFLPE
ncbi:MAG: hypothetical protein Kow0025_02160 [Thermodesulfovibrionales bacterium]